MDTWLGSRSPLLTLGVLFTVFAVGCTSDYEAPPEGYERSRVERVSFRVYGSENVTVPLALSQNRCAEAAFSVQFRTLDGRPVRVYRSGWSAMNEVLANSVLSSPPATTTLTHLTSMPGMAEPVLHGSEGTLRFEHSCEGPFFSGDPERPNNLIDVVMDIVWFEPVP